MENFYNKNGLIFWTEEEIKLRWMFETYLHEKLMQSLKSQNQVFQSVKVEAPILTPLNFINTNYSPEDYKETGDQEEYTKAVGLDPETERKRYEYWVKYEVAMKDALCQAKGTPQGLIYGDVFSRDANGLTFWRK